MTTHSGDPEFHLRAARLAAAVGRREEAIGRYEASLRADPSRIGVRSELAGVLFASGRMVEAAEHFQLLVEADPSSAAAVGNLSKCLIRIGRAEEAVSAAKRAWHLSGDRALWSVALLASNAASDLPEEEVVRDHLEYRGMVPAPLTPATEWSERREGGTLRVGMVSADLRRHPVATFLEPVIPRLVAAGIECHAYYANSYADEVTKRMRSAFSSWTSIASLDDLRALELIRSHRLDVLIDLAGHTEGHRLPVFAMRAAPVQATWLGYPNTTGIPSMDWRIVDRVTDPYGAERSCSERLLRLPGTFLCFGGRPMSIPIERNPGPATFISLNNPTKLSRRTVSLWSRVLLAVPESRLLLRIGAVQDQRLLDEIHDRFASGGVDRRRIQFDPWRVDQHSHLEVYREADVALDPFPYHGTTTTCEALSCGIPVVSRLGDQHRSRVGATLLSAVGLDELVAVDDDSFVRLATILVRDSDRLRELRRTIPERLRRGRLGDVDAFAASLADGLREALEERRRGDSIRRSEHPIS